MIPENIWPADSALNFFSIIARNPYLQVFNIVSLHAPPIYDPAQPNYSAMHHFSASEKATFSFPADDSDADDSEERIEAWLASDAKLRKFIHFKREWIRTLLPKAQNLPPYSERRSWYAKFSRQYKKPGNL